MKTKFIAIAIILIIVLGCIGLVACNKEEEELPQDAIKGSYEGVDYTTLTKVASTSAFDLYQQVYETYKNDTGYYRDELFHFKTSGIEQRSHFVVYRDGDKFLSRDVKVGYGIGPGEAYDLKTLYFDGTNFYSNNYVKNKSIVEKKRTLKGTMEDFNVKSYGTINADSDIDACNARMLDDTSHLTTYIMNDRSLLSQYHNDNVYTDGEGTYYFTIALNCSTEILANQQIAAKQEFIDRTTCSEDSFEMNMDTTIDFTVKEIDGVLKITSWLRHEKYQGKALGLALLKCEQTCKSVLTYDESQYTIDQDVIKSTIA
ncbi:MAG: hypothetical protein ACI4M5_06585 [Christensenellales bacterium]